MTPKKLLLMFSLAHVSLMIPSLTRFSLATSFSSTFPITPLNPNSPEITPTPAPKQGEAWATDIVENIIQPAALIGVPLILLILLVIAIANSFKGGFNRVVRSICTAVLPFIPMTYVYKFHIKIFENLATVNTWMSLFLSFIWGVALMSIIRFLHNRDAEIPVVEVILSFTLSLLLFSYATTQNGEILSYYYGVVMGFLCYIFFFGLPYK